MKVLKKSLSIFLCCALLAGLLAIASFAGSAIQTIGLESYKGGIQTSVWHNSTADITVTEDDKIVFPNASTSATKLICKQVAKRSEVYEQLFSTEATLKFNRLPSGKTFNMGFSLNTIEATIGEAGNIEIEFTNKGGIVATVKVYDDNGNAKTVASKNVGSIDSEVKISVDTTVNDEITVNINGINFCTNYKTGVDIVGRIGFIQTGGCGVEIYDLSIKIFGYDLPQNVNVFEDFNDYEYNVNELNTGINYVTGYPAGVYVDEYKGQGALRVSNPSVAWLSTMHEFSNVEVQYDVLFQQNYDAYNEDGSKESSKTSYHLIALGYEMVGVDGWGTVMDGYERLLVGVNGTIQYAGGNGVQTFSSPEHNISAEENSDRGYTLKFRVFDGVVTVWIKWISEKEFVEIGTVDNSNLPTPKGFIHFRFSGGANMVIDNVKITNLDAKPNLTTLEYKSNKYPDAHHAEYVAPKVVYKEVDILEEVVEEFNFYIITIISAAICVGAFIITFGIVLIVKKSKAKKAATIALNEETEGVIEDIYSKTKEDTTDE